MGKDEQTRGSEAGSASLGCGSSEGRAGGRGAARPGLLPTRGLRRGCPAPRGIPAVPHACATPHTHPLRAWPPPRACRAPSPAPRVGVEGRGRVGAEGSARGGGRRRGGMRCPAGPVAAPDGM